MFGEVEYYFCVLKGSMLFDDLSLFRSIYICDLDQALDIVNYPHLTSQSRAENVP